MRLHALWWLTVLPVLGANPRTPVVVELFTSEGCSSCPRADQLLAALDRRQPVPEAQIIILSEHVDYWDQQGWPDPFASHLFTSRQQMYSHVFGIEDIYTPQMVVNGQVQFSGGDGRRALREVQHAAGLPAGQVIVNRKDASTFALRIDHLPESTKNVEVWIAITEDGLSSDVRRGENAGTRLSHSGVVRSLSSLAKFDARKSPAYSLEAPLALHDEWNRANLHLVVWAQDRASRRIVGAARIALEDTGLSGFAQ